MTKEDSSNKAASGHGGEREKGERQRGPKKEKLKAAAPAPTKVVVRHLPPTMTETEFLQQIDPLPDHDFYYFAAADWSLGYDATCRAYITLKNYDDVFLFRDRFDGYVFVDSKGAEYPAIVEFSPFQGLLKNKSRRTDNKVNMIEQEEHYQQFLQKLQEDREAATKGGECKLEFSLDRKKEEKITSTPLLQYLANKKEKRREEAKKRAEEKRRQRDDDKEKRRQTQPQVTKIYAGQEGSQKEDKAMAAGSKENGGDKGENVAVEDKKNSRSKRRIERDRRRREEHEQRKKERERLDQDRKERTPAKPEKKRERNRNRKDKDKDKDKEKRKDKEPEGGGEKWIDVWVMPEQGEAIKEDTKASAPSDTEDNSHDEVVALVGKGEKVSDSVMTFIRSAVTAMEFVPRHKQEQKEQETQDKAKQQASTSKESAAQEVKEKSKAAYAAGDGPKNGNVNEKKRNENVVAGKSTGGKQTLKQRIAEERRIRNKDRPSIAIYQPKARMRVSEESDKELRSSPTSDCESAKKEEPRNKKVSRYSERRSERRSNRDKPKSSESGDGQETSAQDPKRRDNAEHELCPLKSSAGIDAAAVETEKATMQAADTIEN